LTKGDFFQWPASLGVEGLQGVNEILRQAEDLAEEQKIVKLYSRLKVASGNILS